MTNDELKALYDRMPWAWEVQWKNRGSEQKWFTTKHVDAVFPAKRIEVRLKPRLPADLPEPAEGTMNRAVPLGYGHVALPKGVKTFKGRVFGVPWAPGVWNYEWGAMGFRENRYYCIDINDPNADKIIALNRAETQNPFDVEVETHPVAEMVQSVFNERIQYLLAVNEQTIRDALVALGWTPPGESEWLRLDECNPQYKYKECWLEVATQEQFAVKMIKHGPASVRVRRKPQ